MSSFFIVYCRRFLIRAGDFLTPKSSTDNNSNNNNRENRHQTASFVGQQLIHRKSLIPFGSVSSSLDDDLNRADDVFLRNANDDKMVLVNELTTKSALTAQFALYLPHLIFFLYKIGQSVFGPTTKLYLYASVCSDRYGDTPFTLVNNNQHTTSAPDLMSSTRHYRQQLVAGGKRLVNLTTPSSPVSLAGRINLDGSTSSQHHNLSSITTCQGLSGNEEDVIQMEAADYIMAMKILQDVPAFMLGLFCGSWSDRVGRRLPMMLPCIGGLIVTMLFVFIQASGGIAIPGILFGVAINSFTGRNTLVSMAVQAYVTDQSTEQERTRQLGRILAMNFFGLFAGSFIMAILADRVSFWVVFLCVAVFYAATLALIYFALPESKIPSGHGGVGHGGHVGHTRHLSSSSINSLHQQEIGVKAPEESLGEMTLFKKLTSCFRLDNVTDTMKTITRDRPNRMRRFLICAYLCIVLHNMCKSGEIDVLLLFVKHTPLNWTKSGYGYLLSFQYASVGILLIFMLPFLLNTLKLSDSSIIIGCVVAKAFGLSLLAFSDRGWMVFLSNVFVSTFGMIISCLRSIVTKMVDEDETGKCFAIIASSETVSDLIGVVFFTRLYYIGLSYPNGRPLPFVVMALIHIILLALTIYINHGVKQISGEGALNAGGYTSLMDDNDNNNNNNNNNAESSLNNSNNVNLFPMQQRPNVSSVDSTGDEDTPTSVSNKTLFATKPIKQNVDANYYGAFQQQQQQQQQQITGWPDDNNTTSHNNDRNFY